MKNKKKFLRTSISTLVVVATVLIAVVQLNIKRIMMKRRDLMI